MFISITVVRNLLLGLLCVGLIPALQSSQAAEPKEAYSLPGFGVQQGPLKVSLSSPRYFLTPDGKRVYLNGTHTQLSLQDREGYPSLSFEFLLDFLQEHGHNFTKLWIQEDSSHTPLPYQRTGPGIASDGKLQFDLTKPDPAFFEKLRSRAMEAGKRGIYVGVMLFNGWSVEKKTPQHNVWNRHPFNRVNNGSHIDGDANGDGDGSETHTLVNPQITAIQEAYVARVIESVNDLDNVLYEISNESVPTDENTAWQYHMINFIHAFERTKPKQHPVGMTVQWPKGRNAVLYDSQADWISPNPDDGYRTDPPLTDHGKVILNDTDHLWGNGGTADWVWISFTRGLNPIFMDLFPPLSDMYQLPSAEQVRVALGDTRAYAKRMELDQATPKRDLCSTTFCLVNPGKEYIVYFGPTRWCALSFLGPLSQCKFTLDLSGFDKPFVEEWFNPITRQTITGRSTIGGAVRTFIAPFREGSVLYLKAQQN